MDWQAAFDEAQRTKTANVVCMKWGKLYGPEWVNKLYGQAFAAIYVKPGAQVAVHLDRQLEIDYETLGRKVRHASGGAHVSALD